MLLAVRSRSVEADTRVERTERSCGLARIRRGKPVVARGVVGRRCLIFLFFSILHRKPYVAGAAAAPPLPLYRPAHTGRRWRPTTDDPRRPTRRPAHAGRCPLWRK